MDAGASEEITRQLYKMASVVDGVKGIHRLRTRHHGGLFVDMHLYVDESLTVKQGHDIADEVERLLLNQGPNIIEVLIHVDPGVLTLTDFSDGAFIQTFVGNHFNGLGRAR